MKKVALKTLKIFFLIIVILIAMSLVDIASVFLGNRPIFAIEEKQSDKSNRKYNGLFFDIYNCYVYSSYQIKSKWNKYTCPQVNNNVDEEKTKMAKLTLVGDLLFEQPFYDAVNNGDDPNSYFSMVKQRFEVDDLSVGNMEVVIGNKNLQASGTGYNFCAPEYIGSLVNTLDFEVLGTANNHSYDRGNAGINSTIDFFENNTDITTVGTYKNQTDRSNLRVLNINDIKFGFLAYTYGTNQRPSEADAELIGYYKEPKNRQLTEEYKQILTEEVKKIRDLSEVVVVLMHWGTEFTYNPNKEQKEMAAFLNELGVDIIVGSHSHNIQPIEIIGDEHKTLVYYSLGNFVSHDNDIARTPLGVEEFDNAYQVGLLSTLEVVIENNKVNFQNIDTELIVNYFDSNMRDFKLVPFENYDDKYEKNHYRYAKGLTKDFIMSMYEKVIEKEYRK